jgi:SprT protein
MRLLRQLEFAFQITDPLTSILSLGERRTKKSPAQGHVVASRCGVDLERTARDLLRANGANRIATELRVEWNSRLKTAAGRADYRKKLISLNLRLMDHPEEIDRTLRHELAHILAQFRAGRRRVPAHGTQWQRACHDLGIGDEKRCHTLPFPAKRYAARFTYRCPNCRQEFPRVRRVRRAVACLACCRAHNGGEFDARFRLRLVRL